MPVYHSHIFFGKVFISFGHFILGYILLEFSIYYRYKFFIDYKICKYFLGACSLTFYSFNGMSIKKHTFLILMTFNHDFFLYDHAFIVVSTKYLPDPRS